MIASDVSSNFWKQKVEDDYKRVQTITLHVLGVVRHWFEYKLPKLLTALSTLQEYVFLQQGLMPGNYSFLSAQLENSFFKGALSVLMDHDVPPSAIRKLERLFSGTESWDQIRERLRGINLENSGLIAYEISKVRSAIR